MGYVISIGGGYIDQDWLDGDDSLSQFNVEYAVVEDAPTFENSDNLPDNMWSDSAMNWSAFLTAVGLDATFDDLLGDRGIPACADLFGYHAEDIHEALERFRATHPQATARFCADWEPASNTAVDNAHLARLTWLDYWMSWAVQNCSTPMFYVG